ncbi:APC family permease [Accumulibacter sp.]|uniref:APC family permease n=1 Tax=Accumulibacter sp. TaxID=2053492 RepID=UPI0025D0964D|nr:APC family permease [Accumulibacter sp.]MCM8613960.1 APC family permease [Accumulibacter sp.]MCM8637777.1 APC family permease [Accumulibacter sp.]MCM8638812.1 APC family permease [Accumulibacter sp.]
MDARSDDPRHLLHTTGAVAIVVGIVVGAGIFKTPAMVAGITQDHGWLIAVWLAGALVSLAGALCYAELCAAHPHAGGEYHFLCRAWGKHLAFLYAWSKAMVINTGSIALLAYVFGDYMTRVVDLGAHSSALWAVAIIIVLTVTNILGLTIAARLQTAMVLLLVGGLAAVVVAGFAVPAAGLTTQQAPTWFASTPPVGMLGLAMVFVLLTFGGWNEAAYLSAEVHGGPRAVARVLMLSLSLITALYLLANLALLHALGLAGLATSKAAGAEVLGRHFGAWGERLLGVLVALAALTSIHSTMIVGARSNYALGRDWALLRHLGRWQAGRGTPVNSHVLQMAISLALVVFGAFQADGFEAMVEFTAPVFWTFLFMVGLAVFRLRRRHPGVARPFRVPLYPLTPLLFCAACAWLAWSSVSYAAIRAAVHVSLLVMLAGLVVLGGLLLHERLARHA